MPSTCGEAGAGSPVGGKRNRSSRVTSNPAAPIAATVSRAVWQPAQNSGQSVASARRWARRRPGRLRHHVFVEAQLAAGPQHPARLAQRDRLVRHRAEHQRQHHRVGGAVGDRQFLGQPGGDCDRYRGARRGGAGQRAQAWFRLDGEHAGHARRVVREVAPVAGADLDHPAAQPGDQAGGGAPAMPAWSIATLARAKSRAKIGWETAISDRPVARRG